MISITNHLLPATSNLSMPQIAQPEKQVVELSQNRQELLHKIRSLLLENQIINEFYELNLISQFPVPTIREIENFQPFDQFLNLKLDYEFTVSSTILSQTFWDLIQNYSKISGNFKNVISFIKKETGFEFNAKIIKQIIYSLYRNVKKDEQEFKNLIELIKNETGEVISSSMLEKIRNTLMDGTSESTKEFKSIIKFLHEHKKSTFQAKFSFKQILEKFQNQISSNLEVELIAGWFLHIVTNHPEAFNQLFQTFLKANHIKIDEFITPKAYRYRPEMDLRIYFEKEWHELLKHNDQFFETFISFFSIKPEHDSYYYRALFKFFLPKASKGFPNTVLGNSDHKLDVLFTKEPSPPLFATDRVSFKVTAKELLQPNGKVPILKINFKTLQFKFEKIEHFYQCLINLLFGIDYVNNPTKANNKVIPRLISRQALGFRFPKNELSIMLNRDLGEKELYALFMDYHVHHHEEDQELLMGFLINAFLMIYDARKTYDFNKLWCEIKIHINIENLKHPILKKIYHSFEVGIDAIFFKKILQIYAILQKNCHVSLESENKASTIKLDLTHQISLFVPHPSLKELSDLFKEFSQNKQFEDVFNALEINNLELFLEQSIIAKHEEFYEVLATYSEKGDFSNRSLPMLYKKICQSFPPGPFNSFAKKLAGTHANLRQVFLSHFFAYSETYLKVYPVILQLSKDQIKSGFKDYIISLKKISFQQMLKFVEDLCKFQLIDREQIEQILNIPRKNKIEDRLAIFQFLDSLIKKHLKNIPGPIFFFDSHSHILKEYLDFDLKNAIQLCMLAYEQGELSRNNIKALFENCVATSAEISLFISNYLANIHKEIDLLESLLAQFEGDLKNFSSFCQNNFLLATNFIEECLLKSKLTPLLFNTFLSQLPKDLSGQLLSRIYDILERITEIHNFLQPNFLNNYPRLFDNLNFIQSAKSLSFLSKALSKKIISKKQIDLIARSILQEYEKTQQRMDLFFLEWIIEEKINVNSTSLLNNFLEQTDLKIENQTHKIVEMALKVPCFFSEKLDLFLFDQLHTLSQNVELLLNEFLRIKSIISPTTYHHFFIELLKTNLIENHSQVFYDLIEKAFRDKQLTSLHGSNHQLLEILKKKLHNESFNAFIQIIFKPYITTILDNSAFVNILQTHIHTPDDLKKLIDYFENHTENTKLKINFESLSTVLVNKIKTNTENIKFWHEIIVIFFTLTVKAKQDDLLVIFCSEIRLVIDDFSFLIDAYMKYVAKKNYLTIEARLALTSIFLVKTSISPTIYQSQIIEALEGTLDKKMCLKHLKNYTNLCLGRSIPFDKALFHKFLNFSLSAKCLGEKAYLTTKILEVYFNNYSTYSLKQKDDDLIRINKILELHKKDFDKLEQFTIAHALKYLIDIHSFENNEYYDILIDLVSFISVHIHIDKNWITVIELCLHKISMIFYRNCTETTPHHLNLKKLKDLYDSLTNLKKEAFILWACTIDQKRLGGTHYLHIGELIIQKTIKILQETPHLQLYKKAIEIVCYLHRHDQEITMAGGQGRGNLYNDLIYNLMLERTKYPIAAEIDFYSLAHHSLGTTQYYFTNRLKVLVLINNYLSIDQCLMINSDLIKFVTNYNTSDKPLNLALQVYFKKLLKADHQAEIKEWFTSNSLIRDYPDYFLKLAFQLHSLDSASFDWDFLFPIFRKHFYRITDKNVKDELTNIVLSYPLNKQIDHDYYLIDFFMEYVLQLTLEDAVDNFTSHIKNDLDEQGLRDPSHVDHLLTEKVLRDILCLKDLDLFEQKNFYRSIPSSAFNFMITDTCYNKIRSLFYNHVPQLNQIRNLIDNHEIPYDNFCEALKALKSSVNNWIRSNAALEKIFLKSISSQLNNLITLEPSKDTFQNDQILLSLCFFTSIIYDNYASWDILHMHVLKMLPKYENCSTNYSFYKNFLCDLPKLSK